MAHEISRQRAVNGVCTYIKPSGKRCRQPAESGHEHCKWHMFGRLGTPGGLYDTNMPDSFRALYQQALDSPELTEQESDLALVTARIYTKLPHVNGGDFEQQWGLLTSMLESANLDDPEDMRNTIELALDQARQGTRSYSSWNEVVNLVGVRMKLIDSMVIRQYRERQYMAVEAVKQILHKMYTMVAENVSNQDDLARIEDGFIRLLETGDPVAR